MVESVCVCVHKTVIVLSIEGAQDFYLADIKGNNSTAEDQILWPIKKRTKET